jgi:hypothetical protein
MSSTRGRGYGGRYPHTGTPGAHGAEMLTQTPKGGAAEVPANFRVPRASGLVGVGVGPAQEGIRTYANMGTGGPGGLAGSLFDLSSVFTWRTGLVLLAVLYVVGFHVTLPVIGRVRV